MRPSRPRSVPDDISLIAGDARQAVQNAIDSVRSTWAAEMETVSSSETSIALQYQPVIDGLRDTALPCSRWLWP
jgi:hypothetical protein